MNLIFPSIIISTVISTTASHACDLCTCYTPPTRGGRHGELGMYASLAEQFTHFGSLRLDGHEVANPANQHLDSSITQIIVGKSFLDDRLALQANFPLIHRDYRRTEGAAIDEGTESGLGDISLVARYELFHYNPASLPDGSKDAKSGVPAVAPARDMNVAMNVFAGVKLPTGDSSRLEEELDEGHMHHEDHEHHEDVAESGIHGHDLALGSGSYDALIGGDLLARNGDWFFQADFQYAVRSEGDHSYRYANDLTWSAGPGWYALRQTARSLAIQFLVSGETKDTDQFQGDSAKDTGLTAVYLGPQVFASSAAFTGELGLDLPVELDNTALQIVPDYRIRAAITFRF